MSQLDRTKAPAVKVLGDLHLPAPTVETLGNGVTLNVLRGGSQPINQLCLVWKGGICESASAVVARLAAIMLMEGANGMSGEEISEALDFRGAIVRGAAGEHFSELTVVCLNSFSAGLLPILRQLITSPDYPQKALDTYKEKEAKDYMLAMSKVEGLSQVTLNPLVMGANNAMARRPDLAEIQAVTRNDLLACHKKVYRAGGLHAFLSGDITPEIYQSTKEMLESLPAEDGCDLIPNPYEPQAPQEVVVEKPDALQSAVKVAFPAPLRSHPDYIPLRFAVMALGGYFGSRLMKNIREDKGYTYGIRAYLLGSHDGSCAVIGAQCDNRYVRPLLNEVRNELERLATVPIEGDEMVRLRQHISSSLIETLDSPFSISEFHKTGLVVNLPPHYFAEQVRIAKILDAEMIMKMARKYLTADKMRIAIAGAPA